MSTTYLRGTRVEMVWRALVALVALASLAACGPARAPATVPPAGADQAAPSADGAASPADAFLRSIEDAAVATEDEIRPLIPIADDSPALVWRDPANRRELLVAAWMNEDDADRFYGPVGKRGQMPADRPRLWVSAAPEAQRKCRAWGLAGDPLRLRMAQMIGLPPDIAYDTYVQLWVDRDALFRPCPDPDPGDDRCALAYDADDPPSVPGVADYHAFLLGLYETSYRVDGAPWNRLGYTLDWAGGDEYGVSEFMLVPGAGYEVESITALDAYCGPE